MGDIIDFIEILKKFDAMRDDDVINQKTLPAIRPSYADSSVIESLVPEIKVALQESGIDKLYQHQSEAIQKALNGANVVLQAPTASGKTLAFQVPMLQSLIQEPNAHALMIYPTKALAFDQCDQLSQLTAHIPDRKIESQRYDGDTEKGDSRKKIRENPPQILITNPDMLHQSFLARSDTWSCKFYKGLKWIILDEVHVYRGYFGSNVSVLLRRFVHYLASLGAHPQFFLSSATCANAREHAENLTGLAFEEVNASNSFRPKRRFYFIRPDIPDHQHWIILQYRAVDSGLACLAKGKSVLVFCPTRNFAESCHRIAMKKIKKTRYADKGINPDMIQVFKAGLSNNVRHKIQENIKDGSVRLTFTTNALEAGIDIGVLDGVILVGFPDNVMSAWQQIGRAGRSWDSDAFVIYYARNNPLDNFYASNLEAFLKKPLDNLVVNPGNEDLIEKHLPCLLFETPTVFIRNNSSILGRALYDAAVEKLKSGASPSRTGRWRPHFALNIRGGGGSFVLKEGSKVIGTLSNQQQFREAYQDAIYMHGGQAYRVKKISSTRNGGEIDLEPVDESDELSLKTRPITSQTVTVESIYDGQQWDLKPDTDSISTFYGKVLIAERIYSIEEINDHTGKVLREWKPTINSTSFDNAHAFWIQTPFNLPVLSQLLRVGALFSIPFDPHDIFLHSNKEQTYLVESYPGGIGVARKIFEYWREILKVGIDVAENCSCVRGCPNCIVPPRSKDKFNKKVGINLARIFLDEANYSHDFVNGLWEPIKPD